MSAETIPAELRKLEWSDMPSYGYLSFDQLREAVSEANIGSRHHLGPFDPSYYAGHQQVGGCNYNSLNRIVTAFILADRSTRPAEPAPEVSWHGDDLAVDRFAAAMKVKLAEARVKGKGGWYDETACSQQYLSDELRRHVLKPDPLDVANFAMFLHQRGEEIAPAPEVEVGDGLLADTGCTSLDDLRDKAAIGVSLMERIADLCKPGSRHEHWAPADDPAEIVFDLANEADDLRRERDEARADRGTIDAEADHWKTEAKNIESDLERTLQARDEARDALETIARTEKSLLASLSRALQDRDEAVRVAVEDERDRLYRKANADYIAAEERGDTIAQEAHAAAAYWLGLNGGKSVDDRTIARRARLRADQRAGDGGEA